MLATGFGELRVLHGKRNKRKKTESNPPEPQPCYPVLWTLGLGDGKGPRVPQAAEPSQGSRAEGHLSGQRSVLQHSGGYRPSTGPRWNCLMGSPLSQGPRLHPEVGKKASIGLVAPRGQAVCCGAHRRQRGMRAPDSWLNFRCTLSSCRVRISSWGMMAVELSLSRLSLRLLQGKHRAGSARGKHHGEKRDGSLSGWAPE